MCEFCHTRQLKPSKSPWGEDDQIGRLNMITDESRAKIMNAIDPKRQFCLYVNYFMGMPTFVAAGDPNYQIWMTHTPRGNTIDNLLDATQEGKNLISYSGDAFQMYTHSGTHMDTFNHFGYNGEIWNGYKADEHLGSRHWEKCGPENYPYIAARAVLIDVAVAKGVDMLPDSYAIGKADLQEALKLQGTSIEKGDIIMIRTGRMTIWPDHEYSNNTPGINIEGAEYLVGEGAMILGADNIALEHAPSAEKDNYFPVHTYLFSEVGVPIIELMNLEEISKAKIYEFGFFGAAMPLKGATGAPIQPVVYPLK